MLRSWPLPLTTYTWLGHCCAHSPHLVVSLLGDALAGHAEHLCLNEPPAETLPLEQRLHCQKVPLLGAKEQIRGTVHLPSKPGMHWPARKAMWQQVWGGGGVCVEDERGWLVGVCAAG